jgi:hypothetical protein
VRPDKPANSAELLFFQLYQLAIGVQMAGPNLTPETFAQGLFHYPPTKGETGQWSFGPNDYTATDDAREVYFDPNAISPFNNAPGRYVQTLGGQRFISSWPAGEPQFPIQP